MYRTVTGGADASQPSPTIKGFIDHETSFIPECHGSLAAVTTSAAMTGVATAAPANNAAAPAGAASSLLSRDNTVLLLVDHQVGLFTGVRDIDLGQLKHNVVGLAKAAKNADLDMPFAGLVWQLKNSAAK